MPMMLIQVDEDERQIALLHNANISGPTDSDCFPVIVMHVQPSCFGASYNDSDAYLIVRPNTITARIQCLTYSSTHLISPLTSVAHVSTKQRAAKSLSATLLISCSLA